MGLDQPTNAGCGIIGTRSSYGELFNALGGGVFATWWNLNESSTPFIAMWFFPRQNVPVDIQKGTPMPNSWGHPYALFQLGADCPVSHFSEHKIIFDLTFCGDWAGSTFGHMCPGLGDCKTYVQNNPQHFEEAYWLINYVRVYQ